MSELAAQWRDAWKQLQKNPLLLLFILLAIVGVAEGAARLIDFTSGSSSLKLGFIFRAIAVSALAFGIAWTICVLSALAALFVVVRAGSSFASPVSIALGHFAGRVALAWFILLLVPNLMGASVGFVFAATRFDEPGLSGWPLLSWILPVIYAAVQAVLASALLSRLPAIALRDPQIGAGSTSKARRRSLSMSYLLVFGLTTAVELAITYMNGDAFSLAGGYRVSAILMAIETLWVTLLSFVAHARAAARDPSVAMVFD